MLQKIKDLMGPTAEPEWIRVARGEIGVKEVPGSGDNPRILQYHQATELKATDDSVAWCSAFVNWVMKQLRYERSHSAAARSWLYVGIPLKAFKPYCIVVLKRGDSAWQGHVGFAIEETRTHVKVLGGNQSDAVNYQWYLKDKVLGYRWPKKQE